MTPSWQRRRNEFNHDWLKNRFIVPLNKWLALLEGEIEDAAFDRQFTKTMLQEWESHRETAADLAREFESAMSPSQIVATWPVSSGPDSSYEWLKNLSHHLWLARVPVRRWVEEALGSLHDADLAYAEVQALLKSCPNPPMAQNLSHGKSTFRMFRDACVAVGAKFSQFPGEITVA
jgi:hypothetical protein